MSINIFPPDFGLTSNFGVKSIVSSIYLLLSSSINSELNSPSIKTVFTLSNDISFTILDNCSKKAV